MARLIAGIKRIEGRVQKRLLLLIIWLLLPSCININTAKLEVKEDAQGNIEITYSIPNRDTLSSVKLYKTVLDLRHIHELDIHADPISCIPLPTHRYSGTITDSSFCRGLEYSYYLSAVSGRTGRSYLCPVATICIGYETVPDTTSGYCYLILDKLNYLLELRDSNGLVKSYPICLGGNPVRRKLHRDNLSTPEGRYRVAYVNLNSQFHKSLLLNYPNAEDRERYRKAKEEGTLPEVNGIPPGIGGDIAIHGGGFGNNWTFGCAAMENEDIDELLSIACIGTGTPVYIVGSEVERSDIEKWLPE
jgi:hypothetical protein